MATHDSRGNRVDPTIAVVEAVAAAKGAPPDAIETPLHEAINPDALNALFDGRADHRGKVTFRYADYSVVVSQDGTVSVTPWT